MMRFLLQCTSRLLAQSGVRCGATECPVLGGGVFGAGSSRHRTSPAANLNYVLIAKFAIECRCAYWEDNMDTTTLLIIIIVILLVGGGGWYGRGRWF
jgi:hypothetical protein